MCEQTGKQEGLIHQRMIAILKDMPSVSKGQKPSQGPQYRFRGVDDVYNAVHPVLKKHGVYIVPEIVDARSDVRDTSRGTTNYIFIRAKYHFIAEDGSSVTVTSVAEGFDTGDKATGKAMSYAQKYAIINAFAIPTADMPDTDKENYKQHGLSNHNTARGSSPQSGGASQPGGSPPPANGAGKGNGKYPLTTQLYKVAKAMQLNNDEISEATRKGLKLENGEQPPRLVDIKKEENQKAVLQRLVVALGAHYGAPEKVKRWLEKNGYKGSQQFVQAASAGKATMKDLEDLVEYVSAPQPDGPEGENADLSEIWTPTQVVEEAKKASPSLTLEMLQDYVQTPQEDWDPDDCAKLQAAILEVCNSDASVTEVFG